MNLLIIMGIWKKRFRRRVNDSVVAIEQNASVRVEAKVNRIRKNFPAGAFDNIRKII